MPRHLGSVEGHGEEEAQRRNRSVDARRTHAGLRLMQLKAAKVLRRGSIRRAAEESCEGPHVPDIIVACLLDEVAHAHVFDHTPAQRADGLLTHRGAPVLREVIDPLILKTGRTPCHPISPGHSIAATRSGPRAQRAPAQAGSFFGAKRTYTTVWL